MFPSRCQSLAVVTVVSVGVGVVCGDFRMVSTAGYEEIGPAVAYNPLRDELAVGFAAKSLTVPIPYYAIQRFDALGKPIGSAMYLASGAVGWGEAPYQDSKYYSAIRIVHNPDLDQYLVVWYSTDGTAGLYGRIVDGDGTLLGTGPRMLIPGTLSVQWGSNPVRAVYNTLAGEFFVSVQLAESSDIWGNRVASNGTPLFGPINLTDYDLVRSSHGLAYAPIISAETPTGRYMLVDESGVRMLNSSGYPMTVVVDPNGVAVDDRLPFSTNNISGKAMHFDVAFGYIQSQPEFLVVWEDKNNEHPFQPGWEWTGIWGQFIDAEKVSYLTTDPDLDEVFPISYIWTHFGGGSAINPTWRPQVAYNPAIAAFNVVWQEWPGPEPENDTNIMHIRGQVIDWTGLSFPLPDFDNVILSRAVDDDDDPQLPALATMGDGRALVAWDDARNDGLGNGRDIYGQFWVGSSASDNDACTDAIDIDIGPTWGTLIGATNDGQVDCVADSTAPDVYYRFTAPFDGVLTAVTCGTNDLGGTDQGIDTVLSLHAACPATVGNQLACNDDAGSACGDADLGTQRDSVVSYAMTGGEAVVIRVSRYAAFYDGPFLLHLDYAPINDACADAVAVSEGGYVVFNIGATTDDAVPGGDCPPISSDVWYRYTAGCTGVATISACETSFDSLLEVYADTGACPPVAPALVCSDDACGYGPSVGLSVTQGASYLIRVGSYGSVQGEAGLTIQCGPIASNDECVNAICVPEGVTVGDTFGATGTQALCAYRDFRDLWYAYSPTVTENVTVSLCGSTFDTSLAIYDGCGGMLLACVDDSQACGAGSLQSEVTIGMTGGQTYLIRIAGHDSAAGEFTLTVTGGGGACEAELVASEPPHDGTWAKVRNNVAWLTFSGPIALPPGAALRVVGPIDGVDRGVQFIYSVEPDGVTLRAAEDGAVLTNQTWYFLEPAAGFAVEPFAIHICTLVGDAKGDGQVLASDLGLIWSHNAEFTDARYDINGDGQVLAADLGVTWSHNAEVPPPKP